MFTGIIQGKGIISAIKKEPNLLRFSCTLPPELQHDIKLGASIAINGICLTVTHAHDSEVSFDVMDETLQKTTLHDLVENAEVNIERSMKIGDEVGGHLVSGHVHGVGKVVDIVNKENIWNIVIEPPQELAKYIFEKGFIALDGASLTVVESTPEKFSVSLIPETLERTVFKDKKIRDHVNIEVDQQTKTIVDTLERLQRDS